MSYIDASLIDPARRTNEGSLLQTISRYQKNVIVGLPIVMDFYTISQAARFNYGMVQSAHESDDDFVDHVQRRIVD